MQKRDEEELDKMEVGNIYNWKVQNDLLAIGLGLRIAVWVVCTIVIVNVRFV